MDDIYDSADQLTAERMCNSEWMQDLRRERQEETIAVLGRVSEAGAKPADVEMLARELGVLAAWRQTNAMRGATS